MFAIRFMGKRQIGELEPAELVTTLLLSELASQPIADSNIPLLSAAIPVLLLASVEIILSRIANSSGRFKRIFCGVPSILIRDGNVQQKEMNNVRFSVEELLLQLRQNGVCSPRDVSYAILEENGKVSVIPKVGQDREKPKHHRGILHPLIVDGYVYRKNMKRLRISPERLDAILSRLQVEKKDVFLLAVDDEGNEEFIQKETEL